MAYRPACAHAKPASSWAHRFALGTPPLYLGHTAFHLGHTYGHTFNRICAEHASRHRNKKPAFKRPINGLCGSVRNSRECSLFSDAEASELAQSRAIAWLFGFQSGTWAQSWAHFLKSCSYSAPLPPSRQRRLSDFAKQIQRPRSSSGSRPMPSSRRFISPSRSPPYRCALASASSCSLSIALIAFISSRQPPL